MCYDEGCVLSLWLFSHVAWIDNGLAWDWITGLFFIHAFMLSNRFIPVKLDIDFSLIVIFPF